MHSFRCCYQKDKAMFQSKAWLMLLGWSLAQESGIGFSKFSRCIPCTVEPDDSRAYHKTLWRTVKKKVPGEQQYLVRATFSKVKWWMCSKACVSPFISLTHKLRLFLNPSFPHSRVSLLFLNRAWKVRRGSGTGPCPREVSQVLPRAMLNASFFSVTDISHSWCLQLSVRWWRCGMCLLLELGSTTPVLRFICSLFI